MQLDGAGRVHLVQSSAILRPTISSGWHILSEVDPVVPYDAVAIVADLVQDPTAPLDEPNRAQIVVFAHQKQTPKPAERAYERTSLSGPCGDPPSPSRRTDAVAHMAKSQNLVVGYNRSAMPPSTASPSTIHHSRAAGSIRTRSTQTANPSALSTSSSASMPNPSSWKPGPHSR